MSSVLWTLGSFLVAIIILVTVHEFGHFYAARRLGVRVLRFSIGFGKPLLRFRDRSDCEYVISALPLGGYVKMLDEREGDVPPQHLAQSFNRQSVGRRAIIVAAGPLANFLLAILIYWLLFVGGERGLAPIVGEIEANSAAAQAGLLTGDDIVAVDGVATFTRKDVFQRLLHRLGDSGELTLAVQRQGSDLRYELMIDLDNWLAGVDEPDPMRGIGFGFYQRPEVQVIAVQAEGAAAQGGLQPGDIISHMNGVALVSMASGLEQIKAGAGRSLSVTVRRGADVLVLQVTPTMVFDEVSNTRLGRIGAQLSPVPLGDEHLRQRPYSVTQALLRGAQETGSQTHLLFSSLKKLLVGDLAPSNLSGPVGIAKVAGTSADMGLVVFCQTLALLSISLGVMNILPVPMLDGGHLLLYLAEAIKGSPVSDAVQQWGNQLGLFLILSLMVFALYNDLLKL